MSNRRWQVLAVLGMLCLGALAAYLIAASSSSSSGPNSAQPVDVVGGPTEIAGAQLMVRAVDRGDPLSNGRVFVIKGGEPRQLAGPELDCERVYFAAGRGLCLSTTGTDSGYEARIFDSSLGTLYTLPLAGVPSRARVSSDGRYGAMTVFVNGHAYLEDGGYSTETSIVDMRTGEEDVPNLESFEVSKDGRPFKAADFNFWGVTFAKDSDRFYATLRSNGIYYLVEGDVRQRKMLVLRDHVECPSLSPDGTRIAYKSRLGDQNLWQLKVLDLATLRAHDVAERRPIDDQVEWLDDSTLVYSNSFDVYTVPADGSGLPRVVVRGASSPATLRE
ncbi:MAG: TolB-like translocation protein [Solirubrobacterales bacterium]